MSDPEPQPPDRPQDEELARQIDRIVEGDLEPRKRLSDRLRKRV